MDFSEFDDDFKPEDPFGGARAEELTDGDYEFKIQEVKLKEAKGKKILELKLEVMTPGKHQGSVIHESVWLDTLEKFKRFGAVLKRFGFDVDDWTPANKRPAGREFPKAVRWLVGMRVMANKKTSVVAPKFVKDVEHVYHNINFRGRSKEEDGLPRKIGEKELNEPDPNAEPDPFGEVG